MTCKFSKDEIEFLRESNHLEREYSKKALNDAIKAWSYAVENRERLSLPYILDVHRNLIQGVNPKIAGRLRRNVVYVGGDKKESPKPGELEEEIGDWIKDYYRVKNRMTYVYIKKLHVDFEKIHPFGDGNGRVGRILMNVQMINSGLPLITIHEGIEQQEYYRWFK